MRKIALVVLVAAGLLVAAGAAQAKEVMSLKVCGVSGCKEADSDSLKGWWPEGSTDPAQVARTSPAPYYTVTTGYGENGQLVHTQQAYWLPLSGLMQDRSGYTTDPWWKLFPNQRELLHGLVSDVDPFAPQITGVTVGGRKVTDPNSYLRLFGKLPFASFASKGHFVKIVVHAAQANPWMGQVERMNYEPHLRILGRRGGPFRVPKSMGKRVMHRASLAVASKGPAGGHTALYAGIGIAGIAAVGLLFGAARWKARNS